MHEWDQEHVHEGEEEMREEDHPLWATDRISLTTVGIDIGSATSQVIFSRILLRRMGQELSSRYVVYSRESLYRSPVNLTPYTDDDRIDADALGALVSEAYADAGVDPDGVDTGAVILTGEAIRRHNAEAIGELFASHGGRFVCATAGHHMEALLAAHGSGSVAASHDKAVRLLNIDIGGGTTKLACADHGRVAGTAALHVGARLVAVDDEGRIVRLEPGGEAIARQAGLNWSLGQRVAAAELERAAEWMADAIVAAVRHRTPPDEVAGLYVTSPLESEPAYDGVVFSGGVGEYVYGREDRSFGDLGRPLGLALRRRVDSGDLPWALWPAGECIRATVVGASQYSVQVSGNTIYLSDAGLLPRRNLQVLRPAYGLDGTIDPDGLAAAIGKHFRLFDMEEGTVDVALAFHWHGDPSFQRVSAFTQGVRRALSRSIADGRPLMIVFDHDVGRLVGALLKEEEHVPCEVLSIDGIVLRDFDFVDIGRPLEGSGAVPVTIKSLVFQL